MNTVTDWLKGVPRSPARMLGLAIASVYVVRALSSAPDTTVLLTFTLLGIAEGCIFAVAASGLVLTYATTGVFNFAHGGVGMISAYVYFALTVQNDVPVPLGLVLVLGVFAPLLGLAFERMMRSFRNAPVQATIVVTIALLVLFIGIARQAWPSSGTTTQLPQLLGDRTFTLFGATLTWDDVAALVLAIAVAVLLRSLLFVSRTGVAMRAVVDNAELAALNGAPPVTIARYSWILGSVMAAAAGILLAGGTNFVDTDLAFGVAAAYGCAVVGRLKNLPVTFAAAIVLGVLRNHASFVLPGGNFWQQGVGLAIPGIFLFLGLLLVPAAKLSIGRIVTGDAPKVPSLPSSLVRAGLFIGAMAVVAQFGGDRLYDMTHALVFALLLLSLVVLTGYSGQLSLCQYVFLGAGAWAMGHTFGGDNIIGILAAGLIAVPLGVIVALPAMRLQGLYLALVTFGVAAVSDSLLFKQWFFKVENTQVGKLQLLGVDFSSPEAFFVLCAIVFALFAVALLAFRRGPFGRRLAALRDSEAACATLGLDVRRTKLAVFALSAFIAGIAGALFGGLKTTVGAVQVAPEFNIILVLFAVVGGVTTVTGAFLGGALFALLPFMQAEYPDYAGYPFAVVAVGAVMLGRQPNGLAGILYGALRSTFGGGPARSSAKMEPTPAPQPTPPRQPVRKEAVHAAT